MLEQYQRYIDDVISGKVLVCKYVRLAVERQLRDLERQNDPDFQYYFDETKAGLILSVVRLFRHTSGEWMGHTFHLQDFQAFEFAIVFGWVRKDNGKRRFRRVYSEVARKAGKSEKAAVIGNIGLHFDNEGAPQIFSAATTRDQAKEVFNAAKIMSEYLAKDSKTLGRQIKTYAHSISNIGNNGFFQAVSSDANTLDGKKPHIAIIDEYHAHVSNAVLKVMETGMGSRSQPLSYVITTAGFNIAGACYRMRQVAIEILEGKKVDETFFTIIYTLDDGDDWNDPEVWIKSNPNLGVSPTKEFLLSEYQKAKNEGGRAEVEFKTKNLNIWCDAPEVWIPDDDWRNNEGEIEEESLLGRQCFGGLDLASVSDITSLCLFFPARNESEKHIFKWWNFLPENTVQKKSGRVNYALWVQQGWITTTPGNVADYDYIRALLIGLAEKYRIKSVQYDRWNTIDLIPRLVDDGINMQPFGQGYTSMSTPSKALERMILDAQCNTGGNPVARWCAGNVVIDVNPAGDIKPNKEKGAEKIDPIVAAIEAIGGWIIDAGQPKKPRSYLLDNDPVFI